MHDFKQITCVVWIDKKRILLLTTHVFPISERGVQIVVPRRVASMMDYIDTSPVHLECTTFMRGVDVVDHSRELYSC